LQAKATQICHGAKVCDELAPLVCLEQDHLVREIRPLDVHLFATQDLPRDLPGLLSLRTLNLHGLPVHSHLIGPQDRAVADADPLTAGVELCPLLQAHSLQRLSRSEIHDNSPALVGLQEHNAVLLRLPLRVQGAHFNVFRALHLARYLLLGC
jgi:hypothetical protein